MALTSSALSLSREFGCVGDLGGIGWIVDQSAHIVTPAKAGAQDRQWQCSPPEIPASAGMTIWEGQI
ncbi:MAG: hypothetical protein C0517_09230 [Erythrobacter sp.]|nr:hypothetical protein [Erythrobacter sp.]